MNSTNKIKFIGKQRDLRSTKRMSSKINKKKSRQTKVHRKVTYSKSNANNQQTNIKSNSKFLPSINETTTTNNHYLESNPHQVPSKLKQSNNPTPSIIISKSFIDFIVKSISTRWGTSSSENWKSFIIIWTWPSSWFTRETWILSAWTRKLLRNFYKNSFSNTKMPNIF